MARYRDPASGCLSYLITIGCLIALLIVGWVLSVARKSMGPYADPLGFFLLGVGFAAAGPLSRSKHAAAKWLLLIAVVASVCLSGAFIGCSPPGRRSSGSIGGDDAFSVAVGGVLGAFVGLILSVIAQGASGVEEDSGKAVDRPRTIAFAAAAAIAFCSVLWRLGVASSAYTSWKEQKVAAEAARLKAEEETRNAPLLASQSAKRAEAEAQRALEESLAKVRKGAPVKIPAGSVKLGSETKKVATFLLDDVEVAFAVYASCVLSGKCKPTKSRSFGPNPEAAFDPKELKRMKPEQLSYPVKVNAADAQAYCATLGKRLPTEAEWLLAAFGSESRKFPWGAQKLKTGVCSPPDQQYKDYSTGTGPERCEVGTSPADRTPEGVFDLGYSVEEWVVSSEGTLTLGADSYIGAAASDLRDRSYPETSGFRCASE